MGIGKTKTNLKMEPSKMFDDEFSLDERLRFMQQVLPPDDIYDFSDLLLQMNFVLCNALQEFSNIDTVMEIDPLVRRVLENLLEFRLRMKSKDMRIIPLDNFYLND